jgi:hypothetical protein
VQPRGDRADRDQKRGPDQNRFGSVPPNTAHPLGSGTS